jgi:hypothetical protein
MVLSSVRDHFKQSDPIDDRSLINNHVVRVEVQAQRLAIQLAGAQASHQEPAEAARRTLPRLGQTFHASAGFDDESTIA